jgi:hypothetical protein
MSCISYSSSINQISFFVEKYYRKNTMAAGASAGAAISSMITLMRKQSFRNDFAPLMDYSQEDTSGANLEWMNKPLVKYIYRLTGLLSFISTCMNTPKTFEYHPFLQYVTFIIDIICVIVLTIEAVAKMKTRGILVGDTAYLRDRWNHFDAIMVLCIYCSLTLQVILT